MTHNFQTLLDESIAYDQYKADFAGNPRSAFVFSADSKLNVLNVPQLGLFGADRTVAATPYNMTPWAWTQLFGKLGPSVFGKGSAKVLPSDYMLAMRPDLRAHVLNDHMSGYPNGDWKIRTYGDTCRAVLSSQYTIINNTELLDLMNEIAKREGEPKLTASSSVTADAMNVRAIWQDINRDPDGGGNTAWGIGIYIGNGETGNRRGRLLPLIQRGKCQNSIIIDNDSGSGYEFIHTGSRDAKLTLIKAAVADILPQAARFLNKMLEAQYHEIPSFSDVLTGLALQYDWDADTRNRVAVGTEGQMTRAGLVNGVTFAAHEIVDPNDKADMEIIGGRILCAPDDLFAHAARMGAKMEVK